jgi:hypothetical protein
MASCMRECSPLKSEMPSVAREQPHTVAVLLDDQPITVVLDFVSPVRPVGHLRGPGRGCRDRTGIFAYEINRAAVCECETDSEPSCPAILTRPARRAQHLCCPELASATPLESHRALTYVLRLMALLILLSAIRMSEITDLDTGWKLSALMVSIGICGLVSIARGKLRIDIRGSKRPAKLGRRYPSGGDL